METKLQAAHKLHDSLTNIFVHLEVEIRFLRLENKHKEKEACMIERDEIALKMNLLNEYIKEIS